MILTFFGRVLGEKIVLIGVHVLVTCSFLGGGSLNSESRNSTILGILGSSFDVIVGVATTLGSVACVVCSCTLGSCVSANLFKYGFLSDLCNKLESVSNALLIFSPACSADNVVEGRSLIIETSQLR